MKRPSSNAAFSIPDMIMGLAIIVIAIVGIMAAQRSYIQMSGRVEAELRAVSLGNSVMNIIRMHRYDENTSSPWSTSYGPDGGEVASTYDDIDDYAAASWDFSSDGYAGYTVNTRVFCINIASSWEDSIGPGADFKRIIVTINHEAMESPMVLTSIMAGI
jgi:hypothetical protein